MTGARTSSALAVTGKELVEQLLKGGVLGHDVVLAQVVAAGGAGVHLRSEGPLKASLRRRRRERRLASIHAGMVMWGVGGVGVSARCTLQTLCEQIVVMGWKASSWQQTHMKICSILRRKFFETYADRKKKMHHSWKNKPDRMIQSFFYRRAKTATFRCCRNVCGLLKWRRRNLAESDLRSALTNICTLKSDWEKKKRLEESSHRPLLQAVQGFVPELLVGRVLADELLLRLRQLEALLYLHLFGGGLHHGGQLWRRQEAPTIRPPLSLFSPVPLTQRPPPGLL